MKKLIGTLVAALLAAAVFAEVGVGAGWNTAVWAPFWFSKTGDDSQITMRVGTPWGGPVRTGISFAGANENLGFNFDINADSGVAIGDNACVWARPWQWLEIRAGQWFDDTLRSFSDYGGRSYVRMGEFGINVHTFARIYGANYDAAEQGVLLALKPIEGLYIAAGFEGGHGGFGKGEEAWKVFRASHYQVGYTIDGIMAIKAQYIGADVAGALGGNHSSDDLIGRTDDDGNPAGGQYVTDDELGKGTLNAAVDVLAIEGHKISVGAFIPFAPKAPISIAATYNGSIDAVGLNAYFVFNLDRRDAGTNVLKVGVGVGYDLGDGMAIEGDFRLGMNLEKADGKDNTGEFTAGLFFSKGFANGSVGVGVEGNFEFGKTKNPMDIAIPIRITCGF